MSEESLSQQPQDEAPRKKRASKSAKSAKPTKKKVASETAPVDKAAKPDKPAKKTSVEPKSPKSEKAAKPSGSDAPSDSADDRPAIKRGVRGTSKKTAAKKSGKQTSNDDQAKAKPTPPTQEENQNNEGRPNEEHPRKQARRNRNRNRNRQDQPQQDEPKVKLDAKKVAKRAWKIFLGEVNEEGLALIADKDARELARRSLRVSEIYAREEAFEALKQKKEKGQQKEVEQG